MGLLFDSEGICLYLPSCSFKVQKKKSIKHKVKSTFLFFFFLLGKVQISVKLLIQQDNLLFIEAGFFIPRLCGDCTSDPRALTVLCCSTV